MKIMIVSLRACKYVKEYCIHLVHVNKETSLEVSVQIYQPTKISVTVIIYAKAVLVLSVCYSRQTDRHSKYQ